MRLSMDEVRADAENEGVQGPQETRRFSAYFIADLQQRRHTRQMSIEREGDLFDVVRDQ